MTQTGNTQNIASEVTFENALDQTEPKGSKLDPRSFPDHIDGPASPPAETIENLRFLLEHAGIGVTFNVIKKKLEIRDRDGAIVSAAKVTSLCKRNRLPVAHLHDYLEEIGESNPTNPVAEWIGSKPWDGQDRLPAFYATVTTSSEQSRELAHKLMYRWALSAVAAVLLKGRRFRARGVLTLQGGQGIGKTSWVRSMMPAGALADAVIKLDHHMDSGNKDSIIEAVSHWIVEIGELDSSFKKDIARLKGFLTNDCDKLRRPYARGTSEYDRRTVFAATVNEAKFLIDNTGNSRWWTIAVDALDFNHSIDIQQLFAQLAVDFRRGEQWWLTADEERELETSNQRYRAFSVIEEQVTGYLEQSKTWRHRKEQNLTASELLTVLGFKNPTNPQGRECGSVLRDHLGPPRRINGRDKWKLPVQQHCSIPEEDEY